MRKLIFAAALLCAGASPVLAKVDPAVQHALTAAEQRTDLLHDQPGPFQLDADFIASSPAPLNGHLTLKWMAPDHWLRKIVAGSFAMTEIRDGDRTFTTRSLAFTPDRIADLIFLFDFGSGQTLTVQRDKIRIENGTAADCLQVQRQESKDNSFEVCLSSATHDIVSEQLFSSPDQKIDEQFADYFDFGSHRFPRRLQLTRNGKVVVTANVNGLSPAAYDASLLAPPEGAIERRTCAGMTRPEPISALGRGIPVGTNALVSLTIGTDGSVQNVVVARGPSATLDPATLKALRSWKFRPAMCGNQPVTIDVVIGLVGK
jgi:TonB family protein